LQDAHIIIMAGGEGKRLRPFTLGCPKPLVRFGAAGRIIDFTLLNCLASQARNVTVLSQHLGEMVKIYLEQDWEHLFRRTGARLSVLDGRQSPAGVFKGTAHAVLQALLASEPRPRRVVVLSGDHIYNMDYRNLLQAHRFGRKAMTVAAVECPPDQARELGVLSTAGGGRVTAFSEKPAALSGRRASAPVLASMGIYVLETEKVFPVLRRASDQGLYDFGRDILPALVERGELHAYPFRDPDGRPEYWRDLGAISAYHRAHLDLVDALSQGDGGHLFRWCDGGSFIRRGGELRQGRQWRIISDSVVGAGTRIGAARVHRSVLGPRVSVEDGALVENSVVMDGTVVPRGARLVNAVAGQEGVFFMEKETDGKPDCFAA